MSTGEPTEATPTSGDERRETAASGSWTVSRGLIAGAAAAGAGAASGLLLGASPAGAANDDPVLLGEPNTASASTTVSTSVGNGLWGQTTEHAWAGVEGDDNSTGGGWGLLGTSLHGSAVYGINPEPSGFVGSQVAGVMGDSASSPGVVGLSSHSVGVQGTTNADTWSGVQGADSSSGGGQGVFGVSQHGIGVWGVNPTPSGLLESLVAGVVGDSASSVGVLGLSSSAQGVMGTTSANGSAAVQGTDSSPSGGTAVFGLTVYGTGVSGDSVKGVDVSAVGSGRLFQVPQSTAGPPTGDTTTYSVGEQIRDQAGALFLCVAGGSPGTWVKVGAGPTGFAQGVSCLLSTPIRIFDSRAADPPAAPTRAIAKLSAGSVQTLQVTGTAVGGISVPAGAAAVIGNVTAVNAEARGFLTCYPEGVTTPSTSSLNYPAATSVANGVTVALSSSGQMDIYVLETTDVLFDVTGFVA